VSESKPSAWGVDLNPRLQRGFDFERAVEDGWTDFFIKASEGPWRNGKFLPMPRLKEFVHRAEAAGGRVGLYAYLVESFEAEGKSGRANAEHFLKRVDSVGGPDGRLIIADFEGYPGKYSFLSPTNGNLEAFGEHVLDRLDRDHPYVIYSAYGYWTGGKPSGPVERYGTKLTWDAQLAVDKHVDHPKSYYHEMEHWGWHNKVWGGEVPIYWQFTWKGHVGGLYLDCDACRLSPAEHKALWRRAGRGQPSHGKPSHKRKDGGTEVERTEGKRAGGRRRMGTETVRLGKVIRTLQDAVEQLEEMGDDGRDGPGHKHDNHPGDEHQGGKHQGGKDQGGKDPDNPRVRAARIIDEYFDERYEQYGEYEDFGDLIVKKADDAGIGLPLACALVEQESGGRNVFGCDEGAPYCHKPVTRDRVEHIVDGGRFGHGMQGIGLTQITWKDFVLEAQKLGGAHLPANQLQVGFELMADYLERYPFRQALGAYNAGPENRGLGIHNGYAPDVAEKREAWARRLEDVAGPDSDAANHGGSDSDEPDRPAPGVYRVRVGPFDTRREAKEFADDAEAMARGTRAVLLEPRDVEGGRKPDRPHPERPRPERPRPDRPHEQDAIRRAKKAANWGKEHLLGIEYGHGWKPGTWPPGPPLYSRCNPKKHTLRYIRNHEMICTGLINVVRAHVLDLPAIGRAQDDPAPGGTAAIGRKWARMKGSRPFSPHHEVPDFWVLYSPFQGNDLKLQGHVGIKLPGNRVLEGRVPHSSANRHVNEVHQHMINICGTGWTVAISPEIWTRR
jgi:hypothetical protein